MFTEGSIEMSPGGSDCRAPDGLWHSRQFANATTIPNYGLNRNLPQMYIDNSVASAGTGGPNIDTSFPGPDIRTYEFVGECQTSQFLMSHIGVAARFGATHQTPSGTDGSFWYMDNIQYNDGRLFVYLFIYYKVGPVFVYFTENVGIWDNRSTPGPNGRDTILVTIDPTYGLQGDGPGSPFNVGTYPQPGGWPVLYNGQPPDRGGYGSYIGLGTTCSSWLANSLKPFYFYGLDFQNPNQHTLGFASFRNQPMLTVDEFMCWHMEYDWLEDPGFV